jgi:hypothetical protein
VRLRNDDEAASPLVVIATFVGAAILVTVLVYALAFDRPEPKLQVVYVQDPDGAATFEVTQEGGGLAWGDVTLRLLDRAGTDQADNFLVEPMGDVDEGDAIRIQPLPPAGTYVLLVSAKGHELARLVVEL